MSRVVDYILIFYVFSVKTWEVHPESVGEELVSAAVLFRHGDRSPISSFPNDPYCNETYWPEGFGQLVKHGKYRAYNLGKYLRTRYSSFISEQYKPKEIYVMSSDVDRTLMTAESVLAGLYPPPEEDIWNKNLSSWEPIPVHSIPNKYDNLIGFDAWCPRYQHLYEEVLQNEFFTSIGKRYANLTQTISEKTGWKNVTIELVKRLVSIMYVYRNHNASYIPDWYKQLDQESLEYIAGLGYAIPTFTKELQQYRAGPFFNFLLHHLDNANRGVKPKLLLLSGHDTTIGSMLNTMGCYDTKSPQFSSAVFWEVYRTFQQNDYKYYVKVFYKRNDTDIVELKVKDCKGDCQFDDFTKVFESINIEDDKWNEKCLVGNSSGTRSSYSFGFIIVVLMLLYANMFQ